jgi:hypothetical protein
MKYISNIITVMAVFFLLWVGFCFGRQYELNQHSRLTPDQEDKNIKRAVQCGATAAMLVGTEMYYGTNYSNPTDVMTMRGIKMYNSMTEAP